LEHKQLLYWYFSGKDPNISAQSYGNTNLMKEGIMLEDEAADSPAKPAYRKPVIQESARPLVLDEAEEGC
jgi:hypothetical protein